MSILTQNDANISQILGVDFGEAKIGLAMADSETRIAFVYATLKNDGSFLADLAKIIEQERIETIIIGVPVYSLRAQKKTAGEELGGMIEKAFPHMKVAYQNEMFTTKSAQDNLHAKGVRQAGKKDDAEAAKIILQEWLDKSI